MQTEKLKKLFFQLVRYGIVGVICFLIDYTLLYTLTEFVGLPYLLSAGISFTVYIIVNYFLNMRFVFQSRGGSRLREFLVFAAIGVGGLCITEGLLALCVEILGLYYMIAKIGVECVTMTYNFIMRKLLIEKRD